MKLIDSNKKFLQEIQNYLLNVGDDHSDQYKKFISLFLKRMPMRYIQKLSRDDYLNHIKMVWELFRVRDISFPKVNVCEGAVSYHDVPRLFLTIINDDFKYQIDTLQTLFNKWHLKAQFFLHPVIHVERSKDGYIEKIEDSQNISQESSFKGAYESVIFIQMKNTLSVTEIEDLRQDILNVLENLAWVSHDQQLILNDFSKSRANLSCVTGKRWLADEIHDMGIFLQWLEREGFFIFLGSRYYKNNVSKKGGSQEKESYEFVEDTISKKGLMRNDLFSQSDAFIPFLSHSKIIPDLDGLEKENPPLLNISKTNQRSIIQRASRIDMIEVLDVGKDGKIKGLYQFIGMFTRDIFNLSAFDIPLIQKKAQYVFDQFHFDPISHDGKALLSIIDSVPRDEMFFLSQDRIYDICSQVLQLQDGGGLLLFIRSDPFGYYMTIMIYLTRERYSQEFKDSISTILAAELGGEITSGTVQIGDLPFARIIYVMEFPSPRFVTFDAEHLETFLNDFSLNWFEHLEKYLEHEKKEDSISIVEKYRRSFPNYYQEQFSSQESYDDILHIEAMSETSSIDIQLYESKNDLPLPQGSGGFLIPLRVKVYHWDKVLPLSDLLPILSNMGLKVMAETTYMVKAKGNQVYIHYFNVSIESNVDWSSYLDYFREAFSLIWSRKIENDEFNQLVLRAGLSARQVSVLRAYVKYLLQIKLPYSHYFLERVLPQYPLICALLVELFESRFQINSADVRLEAVIVQEIKTYLNNVAVLDHDRILRRLMNAILSTLRTNYYQLDLAGEYKDYLALKFDCNQLSDLPQPRPLYEIFVSSSRMQGIHLRGGMVARGGIRWSDRLEDFRTEVLELMKAQNVKNAVIVPLGSKGGFVVKQKQKGTDRADFMNEVIYCYQTLMRGMLDLTDNYVGTRVISPPNVICYDGFDPYLVVAADKGTASFSDVANKISQEYGFWLDDAFASGGSDGYDHKKMGITSRGAWESVKRHFREKGKDVQSQPFTVVGIGDMSGDVFGNGMLRSKKTCLVAAFDHRHIFIDPNPDPEVSYAERQRLFDLPRSSWSDYDRERLSSGGGVYNRSEKSIHLSPEAQALLGLVKSENAPDDVVKAILKAEVDLLWFGGIGTFVKASFESNAELGDIANTGIRIDGRMIRAKVIGEGANLAMTQEARIEYALQGGGVNTDAIDNSAGVDCSDHEVNLKILFSSLKRPIDRERRNEILRAMTDDVAHHVLRHNYEQTQILSVLQSWAKEDLSIFQNLIKSLEIEVKLNRVVEFLPDDETFERRRGKGQGLTRPELSVLLAYAKIALYNKIVASDMVTQPYYDKYLIAYFPELVQVEFKDDILKHPLRREIIATVLSNILINRVGPTFVYELSQVSGCSVAEVVHAFFVTVNILDLERWWQEINELDHLMITQIQTRAYTQIASVLRSSVLRLLGTTLPVLKENLHATITDLTDEHLLQLIEGEGQQRIARDVIDLCEKGVSQAVSERLALLPYMNAVIDIAIIRPGRLQPNEIQPLEIAAVYFAIRSHFSFDILQQKTLGLETKMDWQRIAQLGIMDDISQIIMVLTQQLLQSGHVNDIEGWLKKQESFWQETQGLLLQLKGTLHPDIALLTFVVRHLRRMPHIKKMLYSV